MSETLHIWLQAELQRLDLLLRREILRLRGRYQLSLDEFRGLYVSDQQVDALIGGMCAPHASVEEITNAAEEMRARNAGARPIEWEHVRSEYKLREFELDILLIALAREMQLKYETVYAYLHDDITRKRPTCELALRLFGGDRSCLLPEATLFAEELLQPAADNHFLGRELIAAMPVLRLLTGLNPESRVPVARWPQETERDTFLRATQMRGLFVIETNDKVLSEAMVESACAHENRRLLRVDLTRCELPTVARRTRLLQRLERCAVYVTGTQAILGMETPSDDARKLCEDLAAPYGPVFLAVTTDVSWRAALPSRDVRVLSLLDPGMPVRRGLWREMLPDSEPGLHEKLAARFTLNAGQIRASAAYARDAISLRGELRPPEWKDLIEAVRWQSDAGIERLAQRLKCKQGWVDLVLPPATIRQVREAAGAIRFHQVVFSDWGFGGKHSYTEGLKLLFAGPAGTGKTMTAGVIGNDLGMDVYRIDLSGVVSKYIGETEKNLDKVFRASRRSNTLLFFDEADALFGKRSEVKDAHDRYANIEVAYLLQKMEEHEGPVILASNLRRNIDEAFSRRMQYVIEFPLPDEEHRRLLWRKVFPESTPLGPDVDFDFLATQFAMSGGDIKNVALDSAFLAAQESSPVTMKQLAAAMARQVMKQGRVPAVVQFQKYYEMIARP